MGKNTEARRALTATNRGIPFADSHRTRRHNPVRVGPVNPILRARMPVGIRPKNRRPDGDVIRVRDAILASRLIGDELDKCQVAYSRRTIRVQLGRQPALPEVRRCDGGHGGAERVARHEDVVRRVCSFGRCHGGED